MSAADLALTPLAGDLIEVAAFRGCADVVRSALAGDIFSIAASRWLVRLPLDTAAAELGRLTRTLAGKAAVLDQSSAYAAFRIAGPDARNALAHLCRLDLDARVFLEGHAARTLMAQTQTLVIRPALPDTFDLHVPTTLAASFVAHLVRIARQTMPDASIDPTLEAILA